MKKEWKPDYSITPRRVVCAAVKKEDRIITGARHFDNIMRNQIKAAEGLDFWKSGDVEQGFIDQFGDFMDRKVAWGVALEQNQIAREVSVPGTLYSENLY